MAFIRWRRKCENSPLVQGRVNRRGLTPQLRSLPEGSAREGIWPPTPLLQAAGTTALHGAEEKLAGLLAHLQPKTIPNWTLSASCSSVASQQPKTALATCLPSVSLQQKSLLLLTMKSNTADKHKHTCIISLSAQFFMVELKIHASKAIWVPPSAFILIVKDDFKIHFWQTCSM